MTRQVAISIKEDYEERYGTPTRDDEDKGTTNSVFPLLFFKDSIGIYSNMDDYTPSTSTGRNLASLSLDGIMIPYNEKFEANDMLTRAEAVTILHRLYNHMKIKGELHKYAGN